MKLIERVKKIATSIMPILVVFLSGAVWMQAVCLQNELEEIKTQTKYLIDSDAVIQSQMSNVMYYVELLQQGEDSLIEEQSIRVVDTNFATGKYQVEISVTPKEYSDTTKVSVFFGVNEVPLTFKQYRYQGTTVLSLEDDYDGNVTYLFADGDKKHTEIVPDYQDLNTQLQDLLWGEMIEPPTYQNGTIQFDSEIWYVLNSFEHYKFKKIELILSVGGEPYRVEKLNGKNVLYEDSATINFIENCVVEKGEFVRLYLYVECENGYILEYDLFVGELEEELKVYEPEYRVYDGDGNMWEKK